MLLFERYLLMRIHFLLVLATATALFSGCRENPFRSPASAPAESQAAPLQSETATSPEVPPESSLPKDDLYAPAMSDEELGRLIEALSERTGDFPSDNFVSNETSYLHITDALLDESIQGKAYVGVGPEQNLTYIAVMRPTIAYIVDIRRQNLLQHLVFRALAEEAKDRVTFLARLTGRDLGCCTIRKPDLASVEEIALALSGLEPSKDRVQKEVERTLALMDRLGMKRSPRDEADIRKVLMAFSAKGLNLAYSMKGSGRPYPKVSEILALADPSGEPRSFLSREETFAHVQGIYRANRIVPVVGDFAGDRALRGIAADIEKRNLKLGVFYTSNVEQYLFEGGSYGNFVGNVQSFPIDETSRFIRVWFDQGRAHPDQQDGHRTTSVVAPIAPFLERQHKRPFPTYWHVTTFRVEEES